MRLLIHWLQAACCTRAALSRALDLALVVPLLVVLSPLLLLRGVVGLGQTGRLFVRERVIGREQTPFSRLRFAGAAPGAALASLLNVLRGDMALAGPRPLRPDELPRTAADADGDDGLGLRFSVRPGVFSPYALRTRTGIAHVPEAVVDRDYVQAKGPIHDLGLIVRGLIATVLGGSADTPMPSQLNFFGVPIANTTMAAALDWIDERAAQGPPALVAFVNPDCLNIAWRDAAYHRILNQADLVLPDGIGIHLGCRLLGVGLRANVNGTDLFPLLCERAAANGHGLFLLGARPGVAAKVAERMCSRLPTLRIAGIQDGYFTADETAGVIARINASGAAILLVAFGVPRQEQWLARHHAELMPAVRLGVGGLFDFYSGRIRRAPVWMREIGLEWVWRLLQEPGRLWRRYLIGNPIFLYRVWRQARQAREDT